LGDVIDLPVGATPIDFAFQVHTELGAHISGAKIGGKLVALDTELQNGDIVEITKDKKAKPKQKWLQIAATNEARRKIRSYLTKEQAKEKKKRK